VLAALPPSSHDEPRCPDGRDFHANPITHSPPFPVLPTWNTLPQHHNGNGDQHRQ
jgi:hypothetical protein